MSNIIEARGVSKMYKTGGTQSNNLKATLAKLFSGKWKSNKNEFWALKDVSFDVRQGECFGILGHNGAGKSTLLKILSKITPPTEGQIRVGSDIRSLLQTGTGFHNELSGRENILLGGAILGLKAIEIKKNMDAIIDFSELEKFIDTPLKYYSSGMRARLGFSASVFLDSDIILLDEVLSTGDIAFREKSLNRMKEIIKSGVTVIFVSHSMSEIKAICDRAMILASGVVKDIGTMEDMVQQYREMNLANIFAEKVENDDLVLNSRILDVQIDQYGKRDSTFIAGSPLEINIKLELKDDNIQPDIQVQLLEKNGQIIFVNYFSDEFQTKYNSGVYDIKVTIPSDTLIRGKYQVAVGHTDVQTRSIFDTNKIVEEISVINLGKYNREPSKKVSGKITIPLEWSIEQLT